MRYWTLFVILVTLAFSWAAADKYTSRYDHIDVDAILRNERALNSYVKCILDTGPCTSEAREIRRDLPDALRTDCEKCSEKQKELVRKAAKYLIKEKPEHWKKIVDKYDPERQYSDRFQRFLNPNQ